MEQNQTQPDQQIQSQQPAPNMIPFDPQKIRKSYRSGEWGLKEDYNVQEIHKINIPQGPNQADIASTANQIEAV